MTIYFVQSDFGRIKIGYTRAESSAERVAALQIGSAGTLRLLAEIPGAKVSGEKYLHRLFANDRVQGEWFNPSDELTHLVEQAARNLRVLPDEHFEEKENEFESLMKNARPIPEPPDSGPNEPLADRWGRIYGVWSDCALSSPAEHFEHLVYAGNAPSGWHNHRAGYLNSGLGSLATAKLLHRFSGDPEKVAAVWLLAALRQRYRWADVFSVVQSAQAFRATCVEVLGEDPTWSQTVKHTLPMTAEFRARDSLTWESFTDRVALLRALTLSNYEIVMRWEAGAYQSTREFASDGLVQA